MSPRYRFDRLELAGSLGDLGTLLPMAIGMILINGLSPMGMFFSIGVFLLFQDVIRYLKATFHTSPNERSF
jgi:SulP family sulfate permease